MTQTILNRRVSRDNSVEYIQK